MSIGPFDTNTSTGCVLVNNAYAGPYQVIVYGYATDSVGNHVRIHDGGTTTSVNYPGATYSYGFINIYLGGPLALKLDATADERWTTFAAATHTLSKYHDGIGGKTFSIGFDTTVGTCWSSSSYGNSNNYIQSGAGYSLIAIARCAAANHTKSKFTVAHELGHSIGRQYYGYNGGDWFDADFAATSCPSGAGNYSTTSAEFDSLAFKEGYADFVSAAVWNNRDPVGGLGVLTRGGTTFDLQNGPNSDAAGGQISTCTADNDTNGVSTLYDWDRFFWGFYNQTTCSSTPTTLLMQKIYKWTRDNHRTSTFAITDGSPGPSNLHDAVYYAITTTLAADVAGCTVTAAMNHDCVGGLALDDTNICN